MTFWSLHFSSDILHNTFHIYFRDVEEARECNRKLVESRYSM